MDQSEFARCVEPRHDEIDASEAALGAGLGGNATLIGASANVVVASMSEARGQPISFAAFLRYGLPVTVLTITIATVDLVLRYLLFR